MRPLLGTFVTIGAEGSAAASDAQTVAAVESAFLAIERVERLMSFHRARSDIGRLNRARPGSALRVHRWTYLVLRESLALWRASRGTFDCNVGRQLARAGLLPRSVRTSACRMVPLGKSISLAACRVKLLHPVALDLGGIAKGFAVDQAIRVLRSRGLVSAVVNAGGDLRAFGDEPLPVWLRSPHAPGERQLLGNLRNGAIATSASYFTREASADGIAASAVVDPVTGRRAPLQGSVSVVAKTCMQADALTKIAALQERLPAVLRRKAQAKVIRL